MNDIEVLLGILLRRPEVIVTFLVTSLVLAPVGAVLAARADLPRGRSVSAVLAALGLALVVALTLARPTGRLPRTPSPFCSVESGWPLTGAEAVLNTLLFVPFAFFAVLAVGRWWPVAVAALMVSCGVEVVQELFGIGTCQTADITRNTSGALLAAGAAALLVRLRTSGRSARCRRSRENRRP